MGIFKEVQNVTHLGEKQSLIRKSINIWANAYNNSALKNLGDKINILNINYYPLDIFDRKISDFIPLIIKNDILRTIIGASAAIIVSLFIYALLSIF